MAIRIERGVGEMFHPNLIMDLAGRSDVVATVRWLFRKTWETFDENGTNLHRRVQRPIAVRLRGQAGVQAHSWALAVQTAETRAAHEQLAEHYEEIAKTMDADAAEEREMLQQYQASPHKYGKRILDLRAQANAMIRDFEMAAAESRKMAQYHRQMAAEQNR